MDFKNAKVVNNNKSLNPEPAPPPRPNPECGGCDGDCACEEND